MVNDSNRFASLTAKVNLAFLLARKVSDQAREQAQREVDLLTDGPFEGPYVPYFEDASKTYVEQRAEKAWESSVTASLSLMGVNLKSLANALGWQAAGSTVKQHAEGLITYKEAVYFLAQKLEVRAMDELGIPR